jgi:hypothetical protein
MEFVINKSKKELLYVIHHIEDLISDDREYTEVGDMHYEYEYQNKINTELLVEQVEKLMEVYKLADDAYYKRGE